MQGIEISSYKYRLQLHLKNPVVLYKIIICYLSYSLKIWMHNHVKILLIGSIIAQNQK